MFVEEKVRTPKRLDQTTIGRCKRSISGKQSPRYMNVNKSALGSGHPFLFELSRDHVFGSAEPNYNILSTETRLGWSVGIHVGRAHCVRWASADGLWACKNIWSHCRSHTVRCILA